MAPSECYVENCGSESVHMRLKLRARAVFAAAYTVFLREIAKRLLVGLEPVCHDLEERTQHIFK